MNPTFYCHCQTELICLGTTEDAIDIMYCKNCGSVYKIGSFGQSKEPDYIPEKIKDVMKLEKIKEILK